MRRILPVFGIVLVLAIGLTVRARAQLDNLQAPDVIFVQGKIVTVDSNFEVVEAVAVKEGRIVAIGKNEQIRPLASAATRDMTSMTMWSRGPGKPSPIWRAWASIPVSGTTGSKLVPSR